MAELKTQKTKSSVTAFLNAIEDPLQRRDAKRVAAMMSKITADKPAMWGPSIVGFGSYHYRYASGREGDWMLTGFSPRKQALTLYIMAGFSRYDALMQTLGKYKTGKSCLYIKRLDDVDEAALEELIAASVEHLRGTYGA